MLCGIGELRLNIDHVLSGRCLRAAVTNAVTGAGTEAHGKGVGGARVASALYELLEHAAYDRLLSPLPEPVLVAPVELYGNGRYILDAVAFMLQQSSSPAVAAYEYSAVNQTSISSRILIPSPENSVLLEYSNGEIDLPIRAYFENSTGWAAHTTLESAIEHALLEVVERDAFSALLLAEGSETIVGERVRPHPERPLHGLQQDVECYIGTRVCLRSLPALAGFVVCAYGTRADHFGRTLVGMGAGATEEDAALRALLELEQECVATDLRMSFANDAPHVEERLLEAFPFLERAAKLTGLAIDAVDVSPDRLRFVSTAPSATSLDELSGQLREKGFDAYYRVVWRDNNPTRTPNPIVVQVVVPGAEHFHIVRLGIPVEPIARMRTDAIVRECRTRVCAPGEPDV